MRIGVLAIQGDITEHLQAFSTFGEVDVIQVKYPKEIESVDGLVFPGGESTTISKLLDWYDITQTVIDFANSGKPVLGTCAGMVLLAKNGGKLVEKTRQNLLGVIDAEVSRNSFGPQKESFESLISIPILGDSLFPGVFIRAPSYNSVGGEVEVLSKLGDKIIAAKSGNILVTAFHPELADDQRLHEYFLSFF